MSEKFIDREYLLDSFKDYNTDIVEKKFDQVNSNLTGEISRAKEAEETLKSRIDTIASLPEGSTTGDAELQDIRVKADGTTATSAGNAVREQFSELKSDLDNQTFFASGCNWIKELYINELGRKNDVSIINNIGSEPSIKRLFFATSDGKSFSAVAVITDNPTNIVAIYKYDTYDIVGYIIADFSKAKDVIQSPISNKAYDLRWSPSINNSLTNLPENQKNKKLGEISETTFDFSECTNPAELPLPLFTNGFVAETDCVVMGIKTISSVNKIDVYVSEGKYNDSHKWRCFAKDIKVVSSKYDEETVDSFIAVTSSYNLIARKGDEVYIRFAGGTFKYSNNTENSYNALASLQADVMTVNYFVSFNVITIAETNDYDYTSNIYNLNMCVIGDSLTQGVDVYKHLIVESYPFYMSRKLGSTVLNYGQMGRRPDDWWSNYRNVYTFDSTIDVVLIMFGTNGGLTSNTLATDVEPYTNYNDYADTSVGCYCKLIEYIMEQTENHAQIILLTPPYSSYSSAQTEIVTLTEPVIRAIAKRYNLPVIDVLNESGMGKFNADKFRPNDGCHFNAIGYKRLGEYISSRVKSYLSLIN